MTNQFAAYNLSQPILDALTLLGYTTPTPIQEAVIPAALNGRDIAARSQTGTGKTLAFAVPICEKAVWEENLPQALVLEPTRELAVQVSRELFQVGRKKRLKVPAVFGGFPIDKQIPDPETEIPYRGGHTGTRHGPPAQGQPLSFNGTFPGD